MSRFPNDPYGFVPECVHCDDQGCDRCCETEPVTLGDIEQINEGIMTGGDIDVSIGSPNDRAHSAETDHSADLDTIARGCARSVRGCATDEQYRDLVGRITAALKVQQTHIDDLQAKVTCMCGDSINHSPWAGHTPVSMFDYAVEQEVQRRLSAGSAQTSQHHHTQENSQ